jgi:hypothetical protein
MDWACAIDYLLEFRLGRDSKVGVFFKDGAGGVGNVSGFLLVERKSRFLPLVGMTRVEVGMTKGEREAARTMCGARSLTSPEERLRSG